MTEVLRVLNHSGLPLQLAVVAGGDDDLYRELKDTEWHLPVHLYNFVNNMPALMRAADCVLSKAGGLIVSESLACGLPMLLVDVLPGQEEGNADYVTQAGAGANAQQPVEALETLHHWLADGGQLLAQSSQNAWRLGRPRAAYEVADLAWAAAGRGPVLPATIPTTTFAHSSIK
jgi:1,2-diacylglycerol 3-beta-galactosyltransferase